MDSQRDGSEVKARAKAAYNDLELIWPESDAWSTHTKKNIAKFISELREWRGDYILNAGCGGHEYGLSVSGTCFNLDFSVRQCRDLARAVVADIESLPFADECFDLVVCVRAVINYSEPYNSISELVRVARRGGLIIADFESTHSAELLFSGDWGRRVSVVERDYAGRLDKTFLFSNYHIETLFEHYGAKTVRRYYYHTSTALWQKIAGGIKPPAIAFAMDGFLSTIPSLRRLASNVMLACRKA